MMERTIRRMSWLCTIAVITCLLSACTDEVTSEQGADSLVLKFEVAGNGISRASESTVSSDTEPGWDNGWNENTVSNLYLLVFDKTTDNLVKGMELKQDEKKDGSWNISDKGIAASHVDNYRFYLIANYGETDFSKISKLEDLKALSVAGFSAYGSKQATFLMDGNYATSDGNDKTNGYTSKSSDNKTTTLTIKLRRALAKVSVRLLAKMSGETTSQQLTGEIPENMKEAISSVSLKFINYVSNSSLITGGTPDITGSSLTYANTSETDATPHNISSYTNVYKPEASDSKGTRFVFYSYANDWFDEEKANSWNTQEPVNTARRTYVLLTVTGSNGTDYKYQIPVNYPLPTYNDKKYSSLTEAQKEEVRGYYELKRNHVYNVTATIEVKKSEPEKQEDKITYTILIKDWVNGKYATLTPEE
jgi:hypothetical protein